MRTGTSVKAVFLCGLVAACSEGPAGPDLTDEARRVATALDRIADSVANFGNGPSADALRHAAMLVRLTGHSTPVTVTIDGEPVALEAVAEQLDFPVIICRGGSDSTVVDSTLVDPGGRDPVPPPLRGPDECVTTAFFSMRTFIAWDDSLRRIVRIVADTGSTPASEDVPDVMVGLPTGEGVGGRSDPDSVPADSGVTLPPVRYPGFMGEYFVRDEGSWWATEGTQSNQLVGETGRCTEDTVQFDWAMFDCVGARFRFEFSMTVEAARWEFLKDGDVIPSDARGSHTLSMRATEVDGVRLTVKSWSPPPIDTLPVDSVPWIDSLPRPDSLPIDTLPSDSIPWLDSLPPMDSVPWFDSMPPSRE